MDKLLQYAFLCHRIPERSFHFHGKQFPICARCTGILCGYIVGLILLAFYGRISLTLAFLMVLPMVIDGTGQLVNKWKSNNIRRLITGILGGIAIDFLIINITISFVTFGRQFGESIFS